MALNHSLLAISRRFWPDLEGLSDQSRLVGVGDVVISLLTAPFALAGLLWLAAATDRQTITNNWLVFILFGAMIIVFSQVRYFFITEIRSDRYGSAEGSLSSMVQWAAALIVGPSALWLTVIYDAGNFLWAWRRPQSTATRWGLVRSLFQSLTVSTISYLIALQFYVWMGGAFPIPALSVNVLLPVLLAQLIQFLLILLIWLPYSAYSVWVQIQLTETARIAPIIKFILLALGLPVLAHPFAVIVAGLYVESGLMIDMFFILGLLMVAYLARQLSWAAETSRQQSRMLEKLEQLGRDIINSPPDASTLPKLLETHVPMMFPSGRVAVWMDTGEYLFKNPPEWRLEMGPVWEWVQHQRETQSFLANTELPWKVTARRLHDPVVLAPILSVDSNVPVGCIYIELRSLAQPWDIRAMHSLFPAVQSLAASIASALYQAKVYVETLQYQSAIQELEFAGRIQASFLPNDLPDLDGWELSVTLLPARETSGDFFDFIQLPDGKVGIMVADVADKGLGAALYMALSRTLIRTYALEYQVSPDIIFFSANERILMDASANLFVTVFYGILDPDNGTLTYCNAGHSPPLLLKCPEGTIHALIPTGMPIGIDEDATWTQATIDIEPGDVLIMYTDGIPDAQDSAGVFFEERRLIEVAQSKKDNSPQEIQSAILSAVHEFSQGKSQFDDITLLVLKRDYSAEEISIESILTPGERDENE